MSAATKFFLVLVAFVCFMQLVEMARLPRDAPATNPIDDMAAFFQKTTKGFTEMVEESTALKEFKEKFNNISADDVKKAVEVVSKSTKENLAQFENMFKGFIATVSNKDEKHE